WSVGEGNTSSSSNSLIFRMSTTTLLEPSCFLTNIAGDPQGDIDILTNPSFSICLTCFSNSALSDTHNLYGLAFTGLACLSFNLNEHSASLHPVNSELLKAKQSLYSEINLSNGSVFSFVLAASPNF